MRPARNHGPQMADEETRMFDRFQWLNAMYEADELLASDRLVASYLFRKVDEDGKAWPSKREIADRTKLVPKTVRKSIDRLKKEGWIEGEFVEHRFGKVEQFTLLTPRKSDPRSSNHPPEMAPVRGVKSHPSPPGNGTHKQNREQNSKQNMNCPAQAGTREETSRKHEFPDLDAVDLCPPERPPGAPDENGREKLEVDERMEYGELADLYANLTGKVTHSPAIRERLLWTLAYFTPKEIEAAHKQTAGHADRPGWSYMKAVLEGSAERRGTGGKRKSAAEAVDGIMDMVGRGRG